jgi:quercetin dioxygenase-like cupin family protein
VSDAYRTKADNGLGPADALRCAAARLDDVDWTEHVDREVPTGAVPALRHLPAALALLRDAEDQVAADALRSCVGVAPWETFYAESDWARPFLGEIACAMLVGPTGIVPSDAVALGLFLLGPHTTYREHAHGLDEVYHVLAGRAEWGLGREDDRRALRPGAVVHTAPDQRHDIRTGSVPLLAAFTWTSDPAAPTYCRSEGPWRGGDRVEPPLANPG